MEVNFTHPRSSLAYSADVTEELQVGQALLALQGPDTGPFLTPPLPGEQDTVYLVRTNKNLPLSMTIGEAGVVEGDVLQIHRMGQGASISPHSNEPILNGEKWV